MEEAGEFYLPAGEPNRTFRTASLPINTSGGDLAEGFIHGMGLLPEAVTRQIRGSFDQSGAECETVSAHGRPRATS